MSRSSSVHLPAPWLCSSKAQNPVAVSVVFAEREQGAPLRSAQETAKSISSGLTPDPPSSDDMPHALDIPPASSSPQRQRSWFYHPKGSVVREDVQKVSSFPLSIPLLGQIPLGSSRKPVDKASCLQASKNEREEEEDASHHRDPSSSTKKASSSSSFPSTVRDASLNAGLSSEDVSQSKEHSLSSLGFKPATATLTSKNDVTPPPPPPSSSSSSQLLPLSSSSTSPCSGGFPKLKEPVFKTTSVNGNSSKSDSNSDSGLRVGAGSGSLGSTTSVSGGGVAVGSLSLSSEQAAESSQTPVGSLQPLPQASSAEAELEVERLVVSSSLVTVGGEQEGRGSGEGASEGEGTGDDVQGEQSHPRQFESRSEEGGSAQPAGAAASVYSWWHYVGWGSGPSVPPMSGSVARIGGMSALGSVVAEEADSVMDTHVDRVSSLAATTVTPTRTGMPSTSRACASTTPTAPTATTSTISFGGTTSDEGGGRGRGHTSLRADINTGEGLGSGSPMGSDVSLPLGAVGVHGQDDDGCNDGDKEIIMEKEKMMPTTVGTVTIVREGGREAVSNGLVVVGDSNKPSGKNVISEVAATERLENRSGDGSGIGEATMDMGGEEARKQKEGQSESVGGSGSSAAWYVPWAWYSSGLATHADAAAAATANTSTESQVEVEVEAGKVEKDTGGPRDADEEVGGEVQEEIPVADDSLPLEAGIGSAGDKAMTEEVYDGHANPIEQSIQANRSGWASFFTSQLFVKAIGYGGGQVVVKRDEHGAEVMDLDSDVDSDSENESKDTESVVGRSRSTGPRLLTLPGRSGSKSSSRAASPKRTTSTTNDPLSALFTGDDDLKRGVAQSLPKTGSGFLPPASAAPPSCPSGSSASTSDKTQLQVVEKSKSAPATPKRMESPSPSTTTTKQKTRKMAASSSPPNLVLPTWEDTFHTAPRSVVLRPLSSASSSTPSSPAIDSGSGRDFAGVGSHLLGKTLKFVSKVFFSKDGEYGRDRGGGKTAVIGATHQLGAGREGGGEHATGRGKARRNPNPPHPLRRTTSSGGGFDITSLIKEDRKARLERFGQELPKSWEVIEGSWTAADRERDNDKEEKAGGGKGSVNGEDILGAMLADPAARDKDKGVKDALRGCRRVVIIGVHGWFPGAMMRTVLGEPTGTSSKFANMMAQALRDFEEEHGVNLQKVTKIPLEGEGTIARRVERLYSSLLANSEWIDDLREADVIFVATHSQGSVVSTHLLDRLLQEKLIYTRPDEPGPAGSILSSMGIYKRKIQRVCCLALCGIHLGPLRYLSSSSLVGPYIQYFESTAARELFDFQNTETAVSKAYVKALQNVLDHGIKMTYVASLNDQVVPIYSGIFTAASHPLILRALYIDDDAYHSSDFLSNLLVLLLRLRNCGISDSGLLAHLSEATAGSLSGVGHSTAYEALSTYSLAVRYLFMTDDGAQKHTPLVIDHFNAAHEQNDYEIPWSLRDVIADERVIHLFSIEVGKLRDAFRDWQPKKTILRDLKRKLQPIQRLPSSFSYGSYSPSKL